MKAKPHSFHNEHNHEARTMNRGTRRISAAVTALAFALLTVGQGIPYAGTGDQAPVEITVRVNEKGFLDDKGRLYGPKNPLRVSKGTLLKVTFLFSEEMTSLAIGDTHQIAIKAEDGWKEETGKIWILNKKAGIEFQAGENGRTRYRAYCILDCLGMEHLTNLVIEVI
jgi:hypothetical protein